MEIVSSNYLSHEKKLTGEWIYQTPILASLVLL